LPSASAKSSAAPIVRLEVRDLQPRLFAFAFSRRRHHVANVQRIRAHMSNGLAGKLITLLTPRELRAWRDGLIHKMTIPAISTAPSASRGLTSVSPLPCLIPLLSCRRTRMRVNVGGQESQDRLRF